MVFKKMDLPKIEKPKDDDINKPTKTMMELLQEGGYTLIQTKEELLRNGLTERESMAFIDIFVNGKHYTQVAKEYNIQLTELMTLHSKFSILAKRYGVDPNKIINMLK